MDVVEIPKTKQCFRIITTKSGLSLEKISEKESEKYIKFLSEKIYEKIY